MYWDGDGSVTPLSVVFGTVYSLQQLSLSLLNVTLGQVRTNQHTAWGHVTTVLISDWPGQHRGDGPDGPGRLVELGPIRYIGTDKEGIQHPMQCSQLDAN